MTVCALGVLNAVGIQTLTLCLRAKVKWKKWYFILKAVLRTPKKWWYETNGPSLICVSHGIHYCNVLNVTVAVIIYIKE